MFRREDFQINCSLVCIPAVALSNFRTLDKLIKLSRLGFPVGKRCRNPMWLGPHTLIKLRTQ